jgi:hypothetical protein
VPLAERNGGCETNDCFAIAPAVIAAYRGTQIVGSTDLNSSQTATVSSHCCEVLGSVYTVTATPKIRFQ